MAEIPPIPVEFGEVKTEYTWQVWAYTIERRTFGWRLISSYTLRPPAYKLAKELGAGPVRLVRVTTTRSYEDDM